jgi:hypothetical protein
VRSLRCVSVEAVSRASGHHITEAEDAAHLNSDVLPQVFSLCEAWEAAVSKADSSTPRSRCSDASGSPGSLSGLTSSNLSSSDPGEVPTSSALRAHDVDRACFSSQLTSCPSSPSSPRPNSRLVSALVSLQLSSQPTLQERLQTSSQIPYALSSQLTSQGAGNSLLCVHFRAQVS